MSLNNKLIYILGGYGLIGKATAEALSNTGSKIIILDKLINQKIKKSKLINKNTSLTKVQFDLEKIDLIEKSLKKILSKYKTPDIFINCSYPKTKDWHKNNFDNIKLKSFKKNIEIQLIANSWTNYLIAKNMKIKNKKGKIIQIGSIYGTVSQDPKFYRGTKIKENLTYPLIKGGITKFMQQLAVYYAEHGIIINTISPGGIINNQDNNFIKKYSAKTPARRMAKPDDIASFIKFICLEDSSYVVGQDLVIDGGYSKI